MSIPLQVFCGSFHFSGYIPRSGIAGTYGASVFNLLRNCQTFSFYFPTSNIRGFWFLHTLSKLIIVCFLDSSHSRMCGVLSHWFWFAFPWWLMILSFLELIIHFCIFGEMSVQVLSPFKNTVNCPFYYWIVRVLYIFSIYDLKIYVSLILWIIFTFLIGVLWSTKFKTLSNLFFSLFTCAFGVISKNYCQIQGFKNYAFFFFLRV